MGGHDNHHNHHHYHKQSYDFCSWVQSQAEQQNRNSHMLRTRGRFVAVFHLDAHGFGAITSRPRLWIVSVAVVVVVVWCIVVVVMVVAMVVSIAAVVVVV